MGDTARSRGFYKSEGEYGFKLLKDQRIAILYIPKGAWVHVESNCIFNPYSMHEYYDVRWATKYTMKHRASKARVVEIISLYKKENVWRTTGYQAVTAKGTPSYSKYDENYEYRVGDVVKPRFPYSLRDETCASGIHYYTSISIMATHSTIWSDYKDIFCNCFSFDILSMVYMHMSHRERTQYQCNSNQFEAFILDIIHNDMKELGYDEATICSYTRDNCFPTIGSF